MFYAQVHSKLIESNDSLDKAYLDLYTLDPKPLKDVDPNIQRLYWGTDFDPVNLAKETTESGQIDLPNP